MLQPIRVGGIAGHFLDLAGLDVPGKLGRRILVAVVKRGDRTWFFTLDGPSNLVADQKWVFDGLLKSVRFEK